MESPHFADPYFLGAVDKTPVYPAGHSIQLKTRIGITYNVEDTAIQKNEHKQRNQQIGSVLICQFRKREVLVLY